MPDPAENAQNQKGHGFMGMAQQIGVGRRERERDERGERRERKMAAMAIQVRIAISADDGASGDQPRRGSYATPCRL